MLKPLHTDLASLWGNLEHEKACRNAGFFVEDGVGKTTSKAIKSDVASLSHDIRLVLLMKKDRLSNADHVS